MFQRHVAGPPFKCVAPGCSYVSPKFYMFYNHWHLHSPLTPTKFSCDLCSFTAATIHRLRCHKQAAHREKRFECSECQAKFATRTMLKSHGLVHKGAGEDELTCSHQGCSFKTKYANYLKTHMKLHTGQDIFKCDFDRYSRPHIQNFNCLNFLSGFRKKKVWIFYTAFCSLLLLCYEICI